MWVGAIVFTPILIASFVYMERHFGPREPLPLWFILTTFPVIIIAPCSCMMIILQFVLPRPCHGRWIIAFDGIFYRYGKSPHRFVPFASLRNPRIEKPHSRFAVIVFDTEQESLRIGKRADGDRNQTDFLPFLNYLIDRLKRMGWSDADLAPLLELQHFLQGQLVPLGYFIDGGWAMAACYFAPLFCIVLPLYPFISAIPYPAIFWSLPVCGLVICLLGFALNSRLERWKNKKIDEKLRALSNMESEA
jgi:hypothetical protein